MDDGRFSSFRKEAKGYVHFLGARKRNQKNIHPYPSSPYMERLKLRTAETDSSECVLVSRDDAMGFLGSKNRGFCFHKIGDEGATALVARLAGRLRTSRIVANGV